MQISLCLSSPRTPIYLIRCLKTEAEHGMNSFNHANEKEEKRTIIRQNPKPYRLYSNYWRNQER